MISPFVYLEFDEFYRHLYSLRKFKALYLIEICLCRSRVLVKIKH